MGLLRTAVIGAAAAMLSAGAALAGPLHDAAVAGDGAAIDALLKAGADINELNQSGETPLLVAALAGKVKIVDKLMVLGADATIRNDRGMTALHAAAFFGEGEEVSLLIGDSPHAARIDINDHDNKFGVTPLIVAAEENKGNIVAALIGYGADIEITERHGYTALTRASYHGHDEIITILLRAGAICQEIDPGWKVECEKRKTAMGL